MPGVACCPAFKAEGGREWRTGAGLGEGLGGWFGQYERCEQIGFEEEIGEEEKNYVVSEGEAGA